MSMRSSRRLKTKIQHQTGSSKQTKTGNRDSFDRANQEHLINQCLKRAAFEEAAILVRKYVDAYDAELTYGQLCVLANALMLANELAEAFKLVMRALKVDGNAPQAPEVLFWVYHAKGDKQALTVLKRLQEDGPKDRKSTYLYWEALHWNNHSNPEKCLDAIARAGGTPDHTFKNYPEVIFSFIRSLVSLGEIDKAVEEFERIPSPIAKRSHYVAMAKASIHKFKGDMKQVLETYIDLSEKYPVPEILWNRALAHLSVGELEEGWKHYDIRWKWKGFPSPKMHFDAPMWNGEALSGRSIVIWGEQGLGDQIMFLSLLLPLIKEDNVSIHLITHPKIVTLVQAWYPETTVSAVDRLDLRNVPEFEAFDYHLPVGSLPRFFLNTHETLISHPKRFLTADPALRAEIDGAFQSADPTLPLVGICWRSSLVNDARSNGYLNATAVSKIASDLSGVANFVSLQYAMDEKELNLLNPLDNVFIPEPNFYHDVLSHAKHVGICDFVITPATATSQLAGIFNRDTLTWGVGGWSFLGQRRYPWYPNHASLAIENNHSKSSLVLHLTRWLSAAIKCRAEE